MIEDCDLLISSEYLLSGSSLKEALLMKFLSGDGRADYLCIKLDGDIIGWLNLASGWKYVGQVKFSTGWDRANLRFADVNGKLTAKC